MKPRKNNTFERGHVVAVELTNTKRIKWIDIAKGVGILLVVLGHSRFGNAGFSCRWINSFHMPLFFFAAGLCYDEYRYVRLSEYFKRKAMALAYPYFGLSLFVAIVLSLFCVGQGLFFRRLLIDTFPGWTIGGFWFIRVLFVVEVLYAVLSFLAKKEVARLLVADILAGIACIWGGGLSALRINTIFLSMFVYAIGHSCRRWIAAIDGAKTHMMLKCGVLMFTAHSIFCFSFQEYNLSYGGFKLENPLKYLVAAMFGVIGTFAFSIVLDKSRGRACKFASNTLAWLGKYSICLLAVHGTCGACRDSWINAWPILGSTAGSIMEYGLIAILMYLLAGLLSFFWKCPQRTKK